MATKTHVELVDDVTGEVADTTVQFGYQGKNYEIDLSETNAKALEESLQEFIPYARVLTGRKVRSQAPRTDRAANDAIRAWAAENGYQIAERGRIPRNVIDAYHSA